MPSESEEENEENPLDKPENLLEDYYSPMPPND